MPHDTITRFPWHKALLGAALSALAVAGCHEIPQDAKKPFAPASEVRVFDAKRFHGSNAAFEKALTARAQNQNDYNRIK